MSFGAIPLGRVLIKRAGRLMSAQPPKSGHGLSVLGSPGSIGWHDGVVVEVHVTVGFGPQTDAPSDGLRQYVLQI